MPKVDVVNLQNEKVGEVELADAVFGAKVNEALLWESVRHHLAGLFLAIEHQTVAVLQAELGRQLHCDQVQMAQEVAVLVLDLVMGGDHLFGDDQDVDRCLWIDVAERQAAVVFMDNVRLDLPVDDLKKDVVAHHG